MADMAGVLTRSAGGAGRLTGGALVGRALGRGAGGIGLVAAALVARALGVALGVALLVLFGLHPPGLPGRRPHDAEQVGEALEGHALERVDALEAGGAQRGAGVTVHV